MVHTALATVVMCIFWFHEAFDTSAVGFSVPSEEGPSAMDAATSKLVFPGAPAMKEIWETRTLAASTLFALIVIFTVRYIKSPWRKVPPGPRRLPIIGNTLQLMDRSWLFSRNCKERFGESWIVDVRRRLKLVYLNNRRDYVP